MADRYRFEICGQRISISLNELERKLAIAAKRLGLRDMKRPTPQTHLYALEIRKLYHETEEEIEMFLRRDGWQLKTPKKLPKGDGK